MLLYIFTVVYCSVFLLLFVTACYCSPAILLFDAVGFNPCLYPAGKYDILKLPDRQRLKKENQL
jgi:hypothetical protein